MRQYDYMIIFALIILFGLAGLAKSFLYVWINSRPWPSDHLLKLNKWLDYMILAVAVGFAVTIFVFT